jgi:hypothetical protein
LQNLLNLLLVQVRASRLPPTFDVSTSMARLALGKLARLSETASLTLAAFTADANLAYIQYCTNYPEAMRELASSLKSLPRFQEFVHSIGNPRDKQTRPQPIE